MVEKPTVIRFFPNYFSEDMHRLRRRAAGLSLSWSSEISLYSKESAQYFQTGLAVYQELETKRIFLGKVGQGLHSIPEFLAPIKSLHSQADYKSLAVLARLYAIKK